VVAQLWQRLNPAGWPLPPDALPAGTALVGGAVRDALLGRLAPCPDLDLVVPSGAIALCRQLARERGGSAVVLDRDRDIARLVLGGWSIDLAACEGGDLVTDLGRRDYSINAIALPLEPGAALLDPTGGLRDLAQQQLQAISESNLLSDPLRLLRGLRLACQLRFALAPQTRAWIGRHCGRLATVASERVLAELEKLACAPDGNQGLLAVLELGLLQAWLDPQTTLSARLQQLGPAQAERLGLNPAECAWALPLARMTCLSDAAGLERLRSSRSLQKRVSQLRQALALVGDRRLDDLAEPERFGLHRQLEAELPALLLLLPATPALPALLQRWSDPDDPLCHPRPPLDGAALQQELGVAAGPQLGQLLQALSRERAFGRLPTQASRAAVLAAAERWLRQAGETRPDEPAP